MVTDARPLTSLDEAQKRLFESCCPIATVILPVFDAIGKVAAQDVPAVTSLPKSNIALRKGWAVRAQDTYGAASLAPNLLSVLPAFVAPGEPVPDNTDALLPDFAINNLDGMVEILTAVVPGEGIRRAGEDIARGEIIVAAGTKLTSQQALILRLAGVTKVPVFSPQVAVFTGNTLEESAFMAAWLAKLSRGEGAETAMPDCLRTRQEFDEAFARNQSDLMIVPIDSESDFATRAMRALSGAGLVQAQGLAVQPGEAIMLVRLPKTASPGSIPVIFVPARIENALAAWLLLIRPWLDRMMNKTPGRPGETLILNRKIASSLGRGELALLRIEEREGQKVFEPLGVGDFTWSAIARADCWLLVPSHSEGYARGEAVSGEYF